MTNGYDRFLRRTNLALNTQASTLTQFGYDNAGRLQSVTNGNYTATYTYLANSPLVSQITFKSNSVTRMTTTKSYDFLNRLTSISSSSSSSFSSSHAYAYNHANQRTRSTLADGSYWLYEYDTLGQVRSGKKYWSDGTPVAGQQFEYGFDDIGNRKNTKAGGDDSGAGLRPASYTNNSLNQITGRGVPGYVDIMGLSFATNTVTVNSQTAYRKGEYFRKELAVTNSSAPLWTNIIVAATGQTSVSGNVLLAKSAELFTYDSDGNLTSDGLWTNTWTTENRLLKTESLSSVPAAGRAREEWTYLPDGRWIQRIVSTNNGSAYYPAYTNRYVWDGRVLLAVLDHTNGLVMSFMRGLDLSGSLQGAGGVGGVLAVNFKTNGSHFCAYDGNGNVAGLVSGTDGAESARYEYGPFAEPVRVTGPVAKLNPIRFSTQYADDVTGNVKYLFRDYSPTFGRWLARDPIDEGDLPNLYCFVGNGSISNFDRDGKERGGMVICPGCRQLFMPVGFDFKCPYCGWPPPRDPTKPHPPSNADHLRPRHGGLSGDVNNTAWFDEHYKGWVAAAKHEAISALEAETKKMCAAGEYPDRLDVPYSRRIITKNHGKLFGWPRPKDTNEERYGDRGQSYWHDRAVLGSFSFQLSQVQIEWVDCCQFNWTATLRVRDRLGFTSGVDAGILKPIVWLMGYQIDGPVITRAEWTLSGSGNCCE